MQQEINLYLLLPAQKRNFLTLKNMAIFYGIFLAFLVLQFMVEFWERHKELVQFNNTNLELKQVEQSLGKIHAQYPMLDVQDLGASLKKLQQELQQKNSVFNLLSPNRIFSIYLLGIAKAAVPDLWLRDIQVEMGSRDLTVKGYALDSNAIQQFMDHLALQQEFAGLHFQLKEVVKTELQKENLFDFTISTQVSSENTT